MEARTSKIPHKALTLLIHFMKASIKSYHYVELAELNDFSCNNDNALDNLEVIMTTGAAVPNYFEEKIRKKVPNLKVNNKCLFPIPLEMYSRL